MNRFKYIICWFGSCAGCAYMGIWVADNHFWLFGLGGWIAFVASTIGFAYIFKRDKKIEKMVS